MMLLLSCDVVINAIFLRGAQREHAEAILPSELLNLIAVRVDMQAGGLFCLSNDLGDAFLSGNANEKMNMIDIAADDQ